MAAQNGQAAPAQSKSIMDRLTTASDNLLGKDGLKFDTRLQVGNDVYYKLAATIIITLVVCLILFLIYRQVAKA